MAKTVTDAAVLEAGSAGGQSSATSTMPVLLIGLGRGGSGKSTLLAEAIYRAQSQGRDVIAADFDAHRSATLTTMFPDAFKPTSEEMPDVKDGIINLLNLMVETRRSAVVDFGGGDRSLLDFDRDMDLVKFCKRRKIEPVALFVLGPDNEDLQHALKIYAAGFFRPKRTIIALNAGVVREGKTVAGAFNSTMNDAAFKTMCGESDAKVFLVNPLTCMGEFIDRRVNKGEPLSFYDAAAGTAAKPLEAVQEFMTEQWLEDLEAERKDLGVSEWLP